MNNRDLMYKAIDLMEENLKSDMTIFEVANEIGFSSYYFSRLFKGVTGQSPKGYFVSRKVTESLDDLKGDGSILTIALEYGFNSPESYTRAFSRVLSMTPSQVRRGDSVDIRKLVKKISKSSIERKPYTVNKEPEIVELDQILLVGISFFCDLTKVNDLSKEWDMLIQQIDSIKHVKQPVKHYQMQFWHQGQDENTLYFFVGVEVDRLEDNKLHFVEKTIDRQKYLKFLHRGVANSVGYTYRYIYETWLPDSECSLPYYYNFECYGKDYLGPYNEDSITEIYIPVV